MPAPWGPYSNNPGASRSATSEKLRVNPNPLSHFLALGLLLSLGGLAVGAVGTRCFEHCGDAAVEMEETLADCLEECMEAQHPTSARQAGNSEAVCKQRCRDNTHLSAIQILNAREKCAASCAPEWLGGVLFNVGGGAALFGMGVLFTGMGLSWCNDGRGLLGGSAPVNNILSMGSWFLYARLLYALSLLLFALGVAEETEEVGLKTVCLLTAGLSLGFQGLGEFRYLMQESLSGGCGPLPGLVGRVQEDELLNRFGTGLGFGSALDISVRADS